ncbi:predicted protein [Sclerotinia sclerotiorum 1980 UF-70]|uniref:Uncharacterized protein n=1 Tax=Sclerotinia sclerotiorum (strain ATCC 18683 / 1980 / Ss-1) TaxID=665079 RepID=A7F5A8_SCLS1|nr:predicted protein [Sclerotinia sclerotiorum 1980 UF-70]EDN97929.1 predicted protein [Sclerotinia sclerotiorum 1980 UF-70]
MGIIINNCLWIDRRRVRSPQRPSQRAYLGRELVDSNENNRKVSIARMIRMSSSARRSPALSQSPPPILQAPILPEAPKESAVVRSPYRGQHAEGDRKREEEPWHWHTKQKKMMKMEVSDAFKFRQWVLIGMAVVAVLPVLDIGKDGMRSRSTPYWEGVWGTPAKWVE